MKDKLIKLFEETCKDFNVPRKLGSMNVRVPGCIEREMERSFPDSIEVPGTNIKFRHGVGYDYLFEGLTVGVGFSFNESPKIHLATITYRYNCKYGKLIPIIGLFLYRRLKKRRELCIQVAENEKSYNVVDSCNIDKTVSFRKRKRFIVQGSVWCEITEEEYTRLEGKHRDSIYNYDLSMLNKRLKTNE